jgi:hypothetical protein
MKIFKIIILATLLLAFFGCGDNTKTPIILEVSSISINEKNISMHSTDSSLSLSAKVTMSNDDYADATNTVTWSDSNYTTLSMLGGVITPAYNGGDANISISFGDFTDTTTVHLIKLIDYTIALKNSDANSTGNYELELLGTFEDNQTLIILSNAAITTTNSAIITNENNITNIQIVNTGDTNISVVLFNDKNLTKTIVYTVQ